jgi:hypothetical protein
MTRGSYGIGADAPPLRLAPVRGEIPEAGPRTAPRGIRRWSVPPGPSFNILETAPEASLHRRPDARNTEGTTPCSFCLGSLTKAS